MKESSSLKIGIGTPTILMIFVVLCMVILSVLSFQAADHNALLVEKEKTYVTNYYEAKVQAEKIASLLDEMPLNEINKHYQVNVIENQSYYQYQCSIDEKKELYVVIEKKNLEYVTFQVRNKEGA